jgi:hypothetical protein
VKRRRCQHVLLKLQKALTEFDANSSPDLHVAASTIPGAGRGLFVSSDIKKGQCLGEYTGNRVRLPDVKADVLKKDESLEDEIRLDELTMVEYDLSDGMSAS